MITFALVQDFMLYTIIVGCIFFATGVIVTCKIVKVTTTNRNNLTLNR